MNGIIHIPLEQSEVKAALTKALQHQFLDNLRNRHPNVQLDSKLRGYVGEIAFKKWSKQHNLTYKCSNLTNESNGMDVDFVFEKNRKRLDLELKTSLIPDIDEEIERSLLNRDIKLIQRGNQKIEELNGDIHIQFYFNQLRLRKDEWLKTQKIDLGKNIEEIYFDLAAFRYENDTFFVAWIDKPTLINQINSKRAHLKRWKYGKREFWCCNMNLEAKSPVKLIAYLKNFEA